VPTQRSGEIEQIGWISSNRHKQFGWSLTHKAGVESRHSWWLLQRQELGELADEDLKELRGSGSWLEI